jgi:hypothetical protein
LKDDEILAAFRQLAEAQAKESQAKKTLDALEAKRDQAMTAHAEAVRYTARCTQRLVELGKVTPLEIPPAALVELIGPQKPATAPPQKPAKTKG